jgi:4-diphosphocytidyl-2-C-methyl-D-erythritol kinase
MTFRARPPAKLNLTLAVGPLADDGYHPLRSVFLRIGLSDRLTARLGTNGRDRLVVTGPLSAPLGSNLVLRAAALVRHRAAHDLPPLEIELEKHIPLAAGLGGGSSDGAAMIELAVACWGVGLSPATRLVLAATLGSDVPFFSADVPLALVEGRGEVVTPLPPIGDGLGVLLVTPPIEVSTPQAFARHDDLAQHSAADEVTDQLVADITTGLDGAGLVGWLDQLARANDLWPAAASLAPELVDLRQRLERAAGRPWLLSGSGSSLFTLYPSSGEAAEAGARLVAEWSAAVRPTLVCATDFVGPDPEWRYP